MPTLWPSAEISPDETLLWESPGGVTKDFGLLKSQQFGRLGVTDKRWIYRPGRRAPGVKQLRQNWELAWKEVANIESERSLMGARLVVSGRDGNRTTFVLAIKHPKLWRYRRTNREHVEQVRSELARLWPRA